MRILFLSNSIGGLVNFRFELIESLCHRGDEVIVSSSIEASPKRLKDIGCRIIPMEMSQRGTNPIGEYRLMKSYERLLKKEKPDVVLAYTIKPNIYGSVACRKSHIPIIANVTGLGTAIENGGLLQKISMALYRWGLKGADFVFFQNQESMDFFNRFHVKPKEQALVAGSGVNLDRFSFTEYPSADNGIHFLFISRILPQKGIQQYLDVAETIRKNNQNAYFHIVGIKDDPYYSDLVEKKSEEGVIIYHGQQTDVRPFIQKCHCLIHPSFYPEGLSNVCLESSATGRPVITTDKSGCREVVDHGKTGFIVKQQDTKDLLEKVEKFLALPYETKAEMGRNAHEKVKKDFNRADVVKRYMGLIDKLGRR